MKLFYSLYPKEFVDKIKQYQSSLYLPFNAMSRMVDINSPTGFNQPLINMMTNTNKLHSTIPTYTIQEKIYGDNSD